MKATETNHSRPQDPLDAEALALYRQLTPEERQEVLTFLLRGSGAACAPQR